MPTGHPNMKISLILASGDSGGGLETHVRELARALVGRYSVHVIANASLADDYPSPIHFHELPMHRGRSDPRLLFELARVLRSIDPDIVHAHANKAATIVRRVRPFVSRRVRFVGSVHGTKSDNSMFETFDRIICVSGRSAVNIKSDRKTVIYNGISLISQTGTRPSIPEFEQLMNRQNRIVAVTIGRLVDVKRFDRALRIVDGIAELELFVIGDGPERERLIAQAQSSNTKNVHFLGHRSDVPALLAAADLCLITSDREGFPYVLSEALLSRRPVLSTDVSDTRKLLPAGTVFDADDETGFRERLVALAGGGADGMEFRALTASYLPIFDWARNNLTLNAMVEKTDAIYQMMLTGRQ